jgi:hypothetical protein
VAGSCTPKLVLHKGAWRTASAKGSCSHNSCCVIAAVGGFCSTSVTLRGLLQGRNPGCVKQVLGATLAATCRAGGEAALAAARARTSARAAALARLLVQRVRGDTTLTVHSQTHAWRTLIQEQTYSSSRSIDQGVWNGCGGISGRERAPTAAGKDRRGVGEKQAWSIRRKEIESVVAREGSRFGLRAKTWECFVFFVRAQERLASCAGPRARVAFGEEQERSSVGENHRVHTGSCGTRATLRGRLQGRRLGCVRQCWA